MSVKDININIKIDDNTKDALFGVTVIIAIAAITIVVLIL
jgi:hypothetical protein